MAWGRGYMIPNSSPQLALVSHSISCVQFVGVPLAVIQQVYVQLDLDCSNETELCQRSQYSKTRIAASYLTSKMEDTIG